MGKKFPKFVEVFWDDAQSTAEWVERGDLPKTPRHVTRGWLVEDSEERLVLAGTLQLTEGDSLGEVVTILKGMVVRVREMRVVDPRC